MPRLRLFPPCLGSLVVEAPRAHGHPGQTRRRRPWLMGVTMQNETIDTLTERPIPERLHAVRMAQPFFHVRSREGLAAHDRFTIDMAGRSHLHATVGHAKRRPTPE